MGDTKVAFIGGSGLYDMDGLENRKEVSINTPFGSPSDVIVTGDLEGTNVAFLPRHGRGHRISPTQLPSRANIYALKSLGVENIVSVSAVGSLKEEIEPLQVVIPDQLIDRTRSRMNTFFDNGIVAHIGFENPFCPELSKQLVESTKASGAFFHEGGTCVVMEGPQFSTRAESELYRSWDADIIGMTALPEAKLAREAEICYATMALVTDYDVWHHSEQPVSVEMVVANLMKNVEMSQSIVKNLAQHLPTNRDCECSSALKDAIITSRDHITDETKQNLNLIIGKYT